MLRLWSRLLFAATFLALVGGVYIASPFVAAWNIREAFRTGDSEYLRHRVDWPALQTSLKPSLNRVMLDLPEPDAATGAAHLSVWQRLKAYVGGRVINRTVDDYLTPEGLPHLLDLGRRYRKQPTSQPAGDEEVALSFGDRVAAFWSRVQRAEFLTPTRLELEVVDRHQAARRFVGQLELRGSLWTLVSLQILRAGPAGLMGMSAARMAR
jgi:Protein of unknown function (DUF2939)